MKIKKLTLLIIFLGLFLISNLACGTYARAQEKGLKRYWDSEGTISSRIHFIINNQKELKLTDEQIKKIKNLEDVTKKNLINTNKKLVIIRKNMKREMWKHTVSTSKIDGLIDKMCKLEKAKTKSLVKTHATLKKFLTEWQRNKLKSLWKDEELDESHNSYGNNGCYEKSSLENSE